jgi:4-hydroxy-tetrahydrodipicolinate synthase
MFPAEVCRLVQSFTNHDVDAARDLHLRMFRIFKDLFIEPNPVPTKTALAWRGAMTAEVRLPLCEMTKTNEERLRKTLDDFARAQ